MDDDRKADPPTLTGEEARQGRILLNTPVKRAIFIGAFVAIALIGFVSLVVRMA